MPHCPGCQRGRVYKYRPTSFTTISGRSPLVATRHTQESLQCNRCKVVYRAPLPAVLKADGIGGRTLYSYSAVAMVCVLRCFGGMPMHRQSRLQQALGVEVPDSSMWDMHERLASALHPVWRHLYALSANAKLFYGDDTGAKILSKRSQVKPNRRTGKLGVRTGAHTTGVIAVLPMGYEVMLFATGIHHTGEVLDDLLIERDEALAPPIFMGDGIESNTVTTATVLYAACNAHAVRRFKALVESYPEYTDYALERYGRIYAHENHCCEEGYDAEQRQQYHAAHSRALMREIHEYGDDLIAHRKIEPNSDLGEAFEYLQNNYRRLTAFCRHPGAPIDNNSMERALRVIVRLRETTKFFRNPLGARVADIILSTGATALAAKINLFDYFVALQRFADDVRQHPEFWVPWKFAARFRELTGTDPPQTHTPPLISVS